MDFQSMRTYCKLQKIYTNEESKCTSYCTVLYIIQYEQIYKKPCQRWHNLDHLWWDTVQYTESKTISGQGIAIQNGNHQNHLLWSYSNLKLPKSASNTAFTLLNTPGARNLCEGGGYRVNLLTRNLTLTSKITEAYADTVLKIVSQRMSVHRVPLIRQQSC